MAASLQPETPQTGVPILPDIKKVKGDRYPTREAPESDKIAFVNGLYDEGESEALVRFKQATYNTLFANGKHYLGWVKSKRQWDEIPLADNEIRVEANYMIVVLRARVQRLVSSEVSWRGIPESNSYEAHDRVKIAINLIRSRYLSLEMEHKLRQALMQASMTGVAALKSFWNPSIGPLTPATMFLPAPQMAPQADPQMGGAPAADALGGAPAEPQLVETFIDANGQPVQDVAQAFHYRPGDTDTAIRTVFNIRVNPEAHGWTEAEGLRWLIDEDVVGAVVARERFPKLAEKIKGSDGVGNSLTYERMIRGSAANREIGMTPTHPAATSAKDGSKNEMVAIREYWEMRSTYFPKGRLIVIVGGVVAYDGEWPHGVFPYAPIFGEPATMSPYGRPPVNDLISPSKLIDRELTAIAKEMIASGTGKFVAWDINGLPDQINTSDENVIRVPMRAMLQGKDISNVIKRMDPASVPSDRWRLIDQAKAILFDIGAYHEVSRGQIPPGLDSGIAIQYLLEQETAQFKDAVESIKRALVQWARHQLALGKWGYTDQRWIPVDRPDLGVMIETVSGVQLPDPETIGLDIESFRPQSESAVRGEVKEFLAAGLIDPRRALRIMDLGAGFDEAYESQTRHYVKARKENLAFQRGEYGEQIEITPGPMGEAIPSIECVNPDGSPFLIEEDDDLIHIDVHNEIALDVTQPWPIREKVLLHIAAHREKAMRMELQMMQMAALFGPQQQGGQKQGGGGSPPQKQKQQ